MSPFRLARSAACLLLALAALAAAFAGCATTSSGGRSKKSDEPDMLSGLVLDPEGKAIPFAKVSVVPQAAYQDPDARKPVESSPLPDGTRGLAVTTEGGRWLVDHVSGEDGASLGMPGGWYYEVTIYKPGYHVWKDSVLFERGALQVDVTLYPDTIDIDDVGNIVDTSVGDTNTGTGVLRQGE
jgi:hypothetical protein